MRVFLAGGTGLIGRRLASMLVEAGHQPTLLSRHANEVRREPSMRSYSIIQGDPNEPGRWQHEVDGCDAVVNLAGHGIFSERWSATVKRKIRDSRVHSTENLVDAIKNAQVRPKVFVHGSAIGFYGTHDDEELTESSPSGNDFLAVVCRECEDVASGVDSLDVRRAVVRTGIVLAPNAGALKFMTPIFKLGPGAPIGSGDGMMATGEQWMSWIHIDDIAGIFKLAIENSHAEGPLNGTAPNPVRNSEFAKTFSAVLKKPYTPWRVYVPFGPPDGLLRLVLGEVASVITTGQRVIPARPLELGYQFKYPELAAALAAVMAPPAAAPKPAAPARPAHSHAHH